MNIVQSKVDFWGMCPTSQEGTWLRIERAGRVCYNSEDKIKPGSAKKFITNILKPSPPHTSVLEHSNLVFRTDKITNPALELGKMRALLRSPFIFSDIYHGRVYIYGNYKAFYEAYCLGSIFNMVNEVQYYLPGYEVATEDFPWFIHAATVCFKTDRAVTHEIVRHRHKTAYSMRSQRYCNESNLEVIKPLWYDHADARIQQQFRETCWSAESCYRYLKENKYTNQQARAVLPNCTATMIVVTAYLSAWEWFFKLRISSKADPAIQHVMKDARQQMRDALISIGGNCA